MSRMTLHRRGITRDGAARRAGRAPRGPTTAARMWPALTARGSGRARLEQALAGYCEAVEANLELLAALGRQPDRDAIFHERRPARPDPPAFTEPIRRLLQDGAADGSLRRRGSRRDGDAAAQPRQLDLPPPAPRPRLGRRARRAPASCAIALDGAGRRGERGARPSRPRGAAVRPRLRRHGPGRGPRAAAVPHRPARLLLRRGRRAVLVTSVGSSAIQPLFGAGLRPPVAAVADAARRPARRASASRSSGVTPSYRATAAAVGDQRPRRRRLPPRGRALRQPGLRRPPRAGMSFFSVGRQRRLRARADPRDAARAGASACAARCCSPSCPPIVAVVLARELGRLRRVAAETSAHVARSVAEDDRDADDWNAFVRLGGVVALRSASTSACRPSSRCGSSTTSAPARAPATRR